MIAEDVKLVDNRDEAELIAEARLGTMGLDGHNVTYGIPRAISCRSWSDCWYASACFARVVIRTARSQAGCSEGCGVSLTSRRPKNLTGKAGSRVRRALRAIRGFWASTVASWDDLRRNSVCRRPHAPYLGHASYTRDAARPQLRRVRGTRLFAAAVQGTAKSELLMPPHKSRKPQAQQPPGAAPNAGAQTLDLQTQEHRPRQRARQLLRHQFQHLELPHLEPLHRQQLAHRGDALPHRRYFVSKQQP